MWHYGIDLEYQRVFKSEKALDIAYLNLPWLPEGLLDTFAE
jgi:hypothetical protein